MAKRKSRAKLGLDIYPYEQGLMVVVYFFALLKARTPRILERLLRAIRVIRTKESLAALMEDFPADSKVLELLQTLLTGSIVDQGSVSGVYSSIIDAPKQKFYIQFVIT